MTKTAGSVIVLALALFSNTAFTQDRRSLEGVHIFATVSLGAGAAKKDFVTGFDFDLILRKTFPPNPAFLLCEEVVGGEKYSVFFGTSPPEKKQIFSILSSLEI